MIQDVGVEIVIFLNLITLGTWEEMVELPTYDEFEIFRLLLSITF